MNEQEKSHELPMDEAAQRAAIELSHMQQHNRQTSKKRKANRSTVMEYLINQKQQCLHLPDGAQAELKQASTPIKPMDLLPLLLEQERQ